ncbi:hypothetical protein B566_EDAN017419 [Ephemera danica]|nr:hypothetical protein B566_EDAN017419 [Ephemera danica]
MIDCNILSSGSGSGGSSGKSAGKKGGLPKPSIQAGGNTCGSNGKGSNNLYGSNKIHAEERKNYKPPHLTVELLYRHNEDMEKIMVQKHRESRSKGGGGLLLDRDMKLREGRIKAGCGVYERLMESGCHGVKRSMSHSWEGETHKASKQTHHEGGGSMWTLSGGGGGHGKENINTGMTNHNINVSAAENHAKQGQGHIMGSPNVNLWPPFSVTVTPMHNTQPCNSYSSCNSINNPAGTTNMLPRVANMIPVYYIPTGPPQGANMVPQDHPGPPCNRVVVSNQQPFASQQLQYVNAAALPNMLYQPIAAPMFGHGSTSMLYPTLAVLQPTLLPSTLAPGNLNVPVQTPSDINNPTVSASKKHEYKTVESCSKFQRPASQATSVKAEPGSVLGSTASVSVQQAMSESSKKGKSLCSPGPTSLELSPDDDKKEGMSSPDLDHQFSPSGGCMGNGDDSSHSSFYSFLKTDKSDDSMKSSPENNRDDTDKEEDMQWECKNADDHKMNHPMRKEPPWLEDVEITPDLVYRYQIKHDRSLQDVLAADLEKLNNMHKQPDLVNEQLSQLTLEMEREGLSNKISLDQMIRAESTGSISGSCSGEDEPLFDGKVESKGPGARGNIVLWTSASW